MRTQKVFFRRTRRGNVSLVASEQYLRDDLPCGLSSCRACEQEAAVLDGTRPVLVLEAGVLEAQLDLFRDGLFGNCVVPLSALAALEASGGGGQLAREARATIATEGRTRGLFVFGDSHHAQVQAGRAAGESVAKWRRREAEAVAAWYRSHAPSATVLLVTDAEAYAREHAPELLGRVAWVEPDDEASALFAPHLSRELLEEGLREGRLRECRFYDTCVDVATGEEVRLTDSNRALPGDRVAVDAAGRVAGVLSRRAGRVLLGTANASVFTAQDGQRVLLRVPAAARRRLVVAVDCWPCHRAAPLGHVARDLGELHSAAAEQQGVLLAHEVPSAPFTPAQLAELPPADARPGLDAPWREDLRALCVASIDPPGCTDIDDALHARVLDNGLFEVGVHIADVASYVREGSPLDEEARRRSTTVYLVDRRVDMLPERLSGHLCSLVSGGAERHAMSVLWTLNAQAEIVSTRFCRSLIRSRASLTYAMAQGIVDDAKREDELAQSLRLLQRLARQLRDRRIARGALLLSSPEVKFVNKSNNGVDAVDVELYQSLESNSTVEEFMLLANICVANRIWAAYPSLALLRRHAPPAPDRWAHLLGQLAAVNVFPRSPANADVAAALEHAPEMARVLVTRHMQQAVYLCAGSVAGTESFAHYGLAVPIYTHFTSPIRRYADVVVHRLLAAAIGVGPVPRLDGRASERVARHINHRHRMAQLAGRASAEVHSKKVLREGGPRVEGASVLALLADGRARCVVPALGLEVLLALDRPRAVLEQLTLRLSVAEGSDAVEAVQVDDSKRPKTAD